MLAGDTNTNWTSNSRSNGSISFNTHTQSEQAHIQADAALKGVKENNNRQRAERNNKAQPDARARVQAEALQKERKNLNHRNSIDDLVNPVNHYFQLSSSIPNFSYVQSPSFGAHSQSVTLSMEDLTNSSHLLVNSTAIFDVVTNADSIASSLNTDVNSLDYFLLKSAHCAHTGGKHTRPGEIARIKSPSNTFGYLLYPEIDHSTDYGRLTLEMCALSWLIS